MLFNWNWRINKRWFFVLLGAIAPGIILSLITHQLIWLMSSFLAVCCAIPYGSVYHGRLFASLNSLLLSLVAYFLHIMLLAGWQWFILCTLLLSLIAGIIDSADKKFRVLSSWITIACVYGAVKFTHYPITISQLLLIWLVALVGLILVMIILLNHPLPQTKMKIIYPTNPRFIENFKYIMPTLVALLAWHYLSLKEPEWVLWSALSVFYLELDAVWLKFKQRIVAGGIGIGLGLLVGMLIPPSIWITYICVAFICLSLRMFEEYFPGFLLRCFCIVVYAANQSYAMALFRITDIIIGGLIGVSSTVLFIKLKDRLLK